MIEKQYIPEKKEEYHLTVKHFEGCWKAFEKTKGSLKTWNIDEAE